MISVRFLDAFRNRVLSHILEASDLSLSSVYARRYKPRGAILYVKRHFGELGSDLFVTSG